MEERRGSASGPPPGALAGIVALDLTTARSGPTCTKILADLGAEVLRIERPGDADGHVHYDEVDLNRNKKRIVLNLQDARGAAVFKRLASRADIIVENYRPGVKHRLGIDYETLSRENPRLIYASISGFGQAGPYRDRPGYDQIIQGMSGLMWLTGTMETAPLRVGLPIADLLAGYFCTLGILTALYERQISGRGQYVATSLLEALVGSLSFHAARYLNTGEVPPPVGNHHPLNAPMGVYAAQDGFLNIAVGSGDMWGRFCRAVDLPELAEDPRFAERRNRVKNRRDLDEMINRRLREKTVMEWVEKLNAAGVACGPIYKIDQVFADPQVRQAALFHEEVYKHGPMRVMCLPVSLSRTPSSVRLPAAEPGTHTAQILKSLGYTAEEIESFSAAGIISTGKEE